MASHTSHTIVGDASLQELEESLRGELIRPDHPSYDEARAVWNGAIDRYPAAIVRCAGWPVKAGSGRGLAG